MKKQIALITIILILLAGIWPAAVSSVPAYAAGATTVNITASKTEHLYAGNDAWSIKVAQSTGAIADPGSLTGWDSGITSNKFTIYRMFSGFDLSVIPAGAEILSATVYSYGQYSEGFVSSYYNTMAAGWYLSDATGTSLAAGDYDSVYANPAGKVLFTEAEIPYDWPSHASNAWRDFDIRSAFAVNLVSYANASNYLWLGLNFLPELYTAAVPPWEFNKQAYLAMDGSGANKPYLQVTYIASTVSRSMSEHTNAAVETTPTGYEVADNITWSTPRMAFADELIEVVVNGESGADITLRLVDSSGVVIDTASDTVRTDGKYYWQPTVPASTDSWVRVVEDNNSIRSFWGYIAPAPSSTMLNLRSYAGSTLYPQYDNTFSSYVVYYNDVMTVYWKTNIGAGELSDYDLVIWPNGDNTTTPMFDYTLADLCDDYYYNDPTYDSVSAWRYAKFTINAVLSGYNTYDGGIIDLAAPYVYRNAGFITPVFRAVSDNSTLTTVHSAYWYLKNTADYLTIKFARNAYKEGDDMQIEITAPEYTHIPVRLYDLTLTLLDSSGNVRGTYSDTVLAGSNIYNMPAPPAGDYQLRSEFSSAEVPFFVYTNDLAFTIVTTTPDTGGGVGGEPSPDDVIPGWQRWFESFLESKNLNNEPGHWLVILILCVCVAFGLKTNPGAATAIICLIIVGAILMRWLNPWFFILVAGGLGWVILSFFNHRSILGGRGDPPEGA